MAIKGFRRKDWPKGKARSALPLIALALGFYAVSKSGKKIKAAPPPQLASAEEP